MNTISGIILFFSLGFVLFGLITQIFINYRNEDKSITGNMMIACWAIMAIFHIFPVINIFSGKFRIISIVSLVVLFALFFFRRVQMAHDDKVHCKLTGQKVKTVISKHIYLGLLSFVLSVPLANVI